LVNRVLIVLMLTSLAFWEAGILLGALKHATTNMGPSRAACQACVVHWR
jgi:hypothetical protein